MYRIALLNMPFANLSLPSIALTQLKAVVESRFKEQVSINLLYLNHDFANYLGLDLYDLIVTSPESQNSGLGDWFFRQAAFPNLPDNASVYLSRYFPLNTAQMNQLKALVLEKRRGLNSFLDGLIRKYSLDQNQLVGFTSMFMQNVASFSLARKIKDKNKDITIVMGGANCESPMGQVIVRHVDAIDYVFSGPGLRSFPQFVEQQLAREVWKCGSIKGVFTKKNYLFNSGPEAIGEELSIDVPIELDCGPFVNAVSKNFPARQVDPVLLFETSRGCWWGERAHCTFCGLNGTTMGYRSMKPELALKQFDSLFTYAPKVSRLEAVDNILPREYLKDVLPFMRTPENVEIFYEVKADLTESDVQLLAKARVKHIQPGIESLATSTLKLMRKGTSAFRNLALLKFCSMYDIAPAWNLLIGFPGEGAPVYEKYVNDLPLLVHLFPPSGVFPVRFDRYSPYFVEADKYGLDLHPLDYYPLIYPFPQDAIDNLAYYFTDRHVHSEYVQTMSKWIRRIREKVDLWIESWKNDRVRPKLLLRQNGNQSLVHDSRSNKVAEYPLGENSTRALRYLAVKPRDVVDLAREFRNVDGFDAKQEIEFFKERGLVFEEHERFFSLVIETGSRSNGTVQ
ncbi:MAG TPA: RiPP maturation radical SAM C-methyltransferase [Pyrinomonadaceae bacterium]|nr:RiPP maturation radical SAM C-methyltransferase [Pyrinomonadaceae bacterium]